MDSWHLHSILGGQYAADRDLQGGRACMHAPPPPRLTGITCETDVAWKALEPQAEA